MWGLQRWQIYCGVGLIVLIFVGVAYSQRNNAYKAYEKYIDNVVKQKTEEIEKKYNENVANLETQIQDKSGTILVKETQIKSLSIRIQESNNRITTLQLANQKLHDELMKIKKPQSKGEINAGIEELGFTTCN